MRSGRSSGAGAVLWVLNHRQEVITESGEVRKNILYTIKCGIVTYALRVLSLRETTVCKVKFTTSTTYVRR